VGVIPGAEFIRRKKGKGFEMGRIAGWAAGRGYGCLCVVNEDMKKPSESLGFDLVESTEGWTTFGRCDYFGTFTRRPNCVL
jgi:rRNA maturation protein Rpf1